LKVGAESGLTAGRFEGASHPKIDDLSDSITLHHQYEIKPLSKETPFLKRGDSGSLIFVLNNTSPVELICVGLAVAATTHGSCIMTPIHSVLKALKLPENSLSVFENSSGFEYVTYSALNELLNNQTEMLKNILQENTENIKTEIGKLSERIKTVENEIRE
jgi:hypothetical protein